MQWNFREGFVPLPSELNHTDLLPPNGKQSITIAASTTIDAVLMWLHGNNGIGGCCSQSYLQIFANDGTLVATSTDITFANNEEHEGAYSFPTPITLNPGIYWLVPTQGPSDFTNGTWIFGSSGDAYADGTWLDSTGTDTGKDAYFKLHPAP